MVGVRPCRISTTAFWSGSSPGGGMSLEHVNEGLQGILTHMLCGWHGLESIMCKERAMMML